MTTRQITPPASACLLFWDAWVKGTGIGRHYIRIYDPEMRNPVSFSGKLPTPPLRVLPLRSRASFCLNGKSWFPSVPFCLSCIWITRWQEKVNNRNPLPRAFFLVSLLGAWVKILPPWDLINWALWVEAHGPSFLQLCSGSASGKWSLGKLS